MTRTEFQAWLVAEKQLVDARLAELLPPPETFPEVLHQATRDAALGGKRLRAAILRSLCVALGSTAERGLTAGCAVECYHAATLVLDDLPCMDDAATRRGQPALHVAYDESTAVLAAQSLIMCAVALLSRPGQDGLPEDAPAGELLAALAAATGSAGLMAGQFLDLLYETQAADVAMLEAIHTRKTGRLFTFCAEAAALLTRTAGPTEQAARQFADGFGLAFQISDDLLDATGDEATLGKPTGQDVHKSTYVTHFGLDGARERLVAVIADTHEALRALPGSTEPLHALTDFLASRTS